MVHKNCSTERTLSIPSSSAKMPNPGSCNCLLKNTAWSMLSFSNCSLRPGLTSGLLLRWREFAAGNGSVTAALYWLRQDSCILSAETFHWHKSQSAEHCPRAPDIRRAALCGLQVQRCPYHITGSWGTELLPGIEACCLLVCVCPWDCQVKVTIQNKVWALVPGTAADGSPSCIACE